MNIQTPEEYVKELLDDFKTPSLAMKALRFAMRKLSSNKTLLEPTPDLTYMNYAYMELFSMNNGKH